MDEGQQGFAPQDTETGPLTTSIAFPVAICPGWQVAYDPLQWVLQHWRAPRWRDRAFCRTRARLCLRIRELIGREHQVAVAHLPDWHPDVRTQVVGVQMNRLGMSGEFRYPRGYPESFCHFRFMA